MHRIDFTVSQARKIVATCPPGSVYYSEAQRVLREHGTPARPVPGIDSPGLGYVVANDDDGDGL